jgi:hypothetical protein
MRAAGNGNSLNRKDELKRWSIEHLLRFKTVFGPKLADAVGAAVTTPTALEPV